MIDSCVLLHYVSDQLSKIFGKLFPASFDNIFWVRTLILDQISYPLNCKESMHIEPLPFIHWPVIFSFLSWFNWWVSFAPEFQCCYFCEPSCLFYLSFNFDFYVSKIMHL